MSEIIINTVKDLFINYKKIINSRYVGDFEFKEFKSFLIWKRKFGFIVNFLLIILSVVLAIKSFIFVKFYGINIFIILISVSINIIISYGLIIFSLINIFELSKTKKYLIMKNPEKIKNFKWSEWQFIDIIFSKPYKLKGNRTIKVNINKSPDYSLNFLCQYPTGNFAWFGIGKSHNEKTKINSVIMGDKSFDDKKFRKNNILEIKEKFIMDEMKMDLYGDSFEGKSIVKKIISKDIPPIAIVGIRVRANVTNEQIEIKGISY